MTKLVRIEVQMLSEQTVSRKLVDMIQEKFLIDEITDFEDEPEYSYFITFVTRMTHTELAEHAKLTMRDIPGIYYMDIEYIYEGNFVPDRVVIWSDGKEVHYTGHIVYTEDGV